MSHPLARRSLRGLELPAPLAAYRPGRTERMYTNPYGGGLGAYPCPRPLALQRRYADWMRSDLAQRGQGQQVQPEQVMFTAGSVAGIELLIRTFCEPGTDAIAIQSPTFPIYATHARTNGIEVRDIPLGGADLADIDVEGIVGAGAKLVFVCRPSNPVGSAPAFEHLSELARRVDGLLVVDEAYIEFGELPSAAALLDRPNVVVLRTFSKAWGLAGVRAGAILAHPDVLDTIRLLADPFAFDTPAQQAVAAALAEPERALASVQRVRRQREALTAALSRLRGVRVIPSEANFLLALLPVAVVVPPTDLFVVPVRVPGQPADTAVRIAIGTTDEDERVVALVQELFASSKVETAHGTTGNGLRPGCNMRPSSFRGDRGRSGRVRTVVVVGAGIVGTVIAVLLSQRGYAVEIVERHDDPRGRPARPGKSVNITLCTRGFVALEEVGVSDHIRALSVPVYGRVIHGRDGALEYQPYGNRRECLYSISRHQLWLALLDLATSTGVPVRFGHRCVSVDFEQGEVRLEDGRRRQTARRADLILAADGARSPIRHAMLHRPGVQYSQRYADHANKELHLPAEHAVVAGLDRNALHIWPRGKFMLIAFPNLDGSLTCTLHMPLHGEPSFGAIRDEATLEALFAAEFANVRPLIPTLVRDYFLHPEIPMLTVRCSPLYAGRVALIGDAAHSVWPSYGQGANAGFEDSIVLAECLAEGALQWALARYDQRRRPDADAIADLSERHFEEIRDQVGDPRFHARKRIERRLNELYPDHYVPLYSRVSFTRMPYAEAVRIEHRQQALVDRLLEIVSPAQGVPDLDGSEARRTIHQFLEMT